MTPDKDSPVSQKQAARIVALLVFVFMWIVAAIIFYKGDISGILDITLVVTAPFLPSFIVYFVVLYNDPDSSD
jgi:hypothetical protein